MGFDVLKKKQNFHAPRPTGIDQTPILRNVVGQGSQYDQSWKTGNGENWSDKPKGAAKSTAVNQAFFKRSNGE